MTKNQLSRLNDITGWFQYTATQISKRHRKNLFEAG